MVQLEDVIRVAILKLEDATRQGHSRVCRTLITSIIREIMQNRSNWRVAIEEGMCQTIIGVIKRFSVSGTERDTPLRFSLIIDCLELLISFKGFVQLSPDDLDSYPICHIVKLLGVDTIVHSLVKHLKLQNRPIPVILLTLRLLYNIGLSEPGARMLSQCRTHEILFDSLGTMSVHERDAHLSMIRVLVTMALYNQIPGRTFIGEHGCIRIGYLLTHAERIPLQDYGYHREVCCLLCMVATNLFGASAILSREDAIGYCVKTLHAATNALTESTDPSVAVNSGFGDSFTSSKSEQGKYSDNGVFANLQSGGATLDAYARNAVSAGSSYISSFMKALPSVGAEVSSSDASQSKSGDTRSDELRKVACWASMVLNNLCVASKNDEQMRVVITQAYDSSNLAIGSSSEIPLFSKISSNLISICTDSGANRIDFLESLSTTPVSKLVDFIVNGVSAYDSRDDTCGRSILVNFASLKARSGVTWEMLLGELLTRFTKIVTGEDPAHGAVLPMPAAGMRIVSFLCMLLAHPVFQRKLIQEPEALRIIIGSSENDFCFFGMLRSMCIPEYWGFLDRYFQHVVNGEHLRILTPLPYRVLPNSPQDSAKMTELLIRQHPSRSSSSSVDSFLAKHASAPQSPELDDQGGTNVGESRLRSSSSTTYMPSQSNVVLSPLYTGKRLQSSEASLHDSDSNDEGPFSPSQKNAVLSLGKYEEQIELVATQISLRFERMYLLTDPGRFVTLACDPDHSHKGPEAMFLEEYEKVLYFFKSEILHGETPFSRARIVETIIKIAATGASPMLRDANLTMACLEALECPSIRRLEITWRNVDRQQSRTFDELKLLCGFEVTGKQMTNNTNSTSLMKIEDDSLVASLSYTKFFGVARIPFVKGMMVALRMARKSIMRSASVPSIGEKPESPKAKYTKPEESQEEELLLDFSYDDENHNNNQVSPVSAEQSLGGTGEFDPLGLFTKKSCDDIELPVTPVEVDTVDQQYQLMTEWMTTIRGDGDWYQKVYAFTLDVPLQIMLKCLPSVAKDPLQHLDAISLRQEPPWSLDQMLLESLYAIEGWIESLFESEVEEEGRVIRAFRSRIGSAAKEVASAPNLTGPGGRVTQTIGQAAGIFSVNAYGNETEGGPRPNAGNQVSAMSTGKLINTMVRKISGARRERLLEESGSRSAEHWDRIMSHVRLCVERIVLAPVLSRLVLAALREHSKNDCALQERILMLKSANHSRLVDILGLPTRENLHEEQWRGPIATLQSIDIVDMPSLKLEVLLRLKNQIFAQADSCGVRDMNADEFLPVMTFVIVKAELKHAYSTTMLLRELLSDEFVSGEAAYYLTTFEIALGHLLGMPMPSDLLAEI